MSDLTTKITQITAAQARKEETANANFGSVSIASWFGKLPASTGLTWHYTGVDRWYINGTATVKANTSIALTGSSTRYLSADRALAVTENATAFPAAQLALYELTTSGSAVTGELDHRNAKHQVRFLYDRQTSAMGDANKTLTYAQAMADSLELTGALTALRDVIVPVVPRCYTIYANTSGGFGVRVIAASGTGITIADTKRAIVEFDGTNVVRITADV